MQSSRTFAICLIALTLAAVYVYWTTWNTWSKAVNKCCEKPVKRCMSCRKGMTIGEFCAQNPGRFDCDPVERPDTCCNKINRVCLACKAGVSVAEFCKEHPGEYGCQKQGISCCQAKSKECLSCQNHQAVSDFCQDKGDQYGCLDECCSQENKECLSCQKNVSVNEFCEKSPGLYGCPQKGHGGIMLGISMLHKKGYLQFTASVLRKYHTISGRDIHLFDFASTPFTNDDISRWYGKDVRYLPSNETFGLGAQVRRILNYFVASDYKILFIVDAGTIFLEGWNDFIEKHIYKDTDGFLSLYHSAANHIYTANCEKMVGELCEGQVHGRLGVAITQALAETMLKKRLSAFFHLNWTSILEGEDVRFLYPEKSLTMQITQNYQSTDNCGVSEVAYRFNRCALPKWIKNGIEFYFDRCTSPDEIYSPEHSMQDIEREGRLWTRPVISYSFYGTRPRYIQPAMENAVRVFSVYPGWKIWLYTDYSPPKDIMDKLCEFDVRFINMSNSKIKSKMTWRFLVASEPVKRYAIRDIDSHLLKRGKAAVDEWIKSGRMFHTMRDHREHSKYPMNGQMWGGVYGGIPNMKNLLISKSGKFNNHFMQDMNFLNRYIWKIVNKSVWQHDSHPGDKFGEVHPFPTATESPGMFVGGVLIDKNVETLEELGPRFP